MLVKKDFIWNLVYDLRGSVTNLTEFVISNIFLYCYKNFGVKGYFDNINLVDKAKEMNLHYNDGLIINFQNALDKMQREDIDEFIGTCITNGIDDFRIRDNSNWQISRLALNILELKDGGDILLDIGSGLGGFLYNASQYGVDQKFAYKDLLGIELNPNDAYLSAMAFASLSVKSSNVFIKCYNALDKISLPYTKCFLYPPFGLKYSNYEAGQISLINEQQFTTKNSIEWIFIDRMLGSFDGCKKSIALVTPRALFNNADKEYRNELIERGLLEAIIELPAGSLDTTNSKICMLVFSKNNKDVKLVDASNCVENLTRLNKVVLPYEKVLDMYRSENVVTKNKKELINAFSLLPSALFNIPTKPKNGIELKELAEVFTGSQYTVKNFSDMFTTNNTGYRILTSSDINDGNVSWKTLQKIDYKDNKFDKFAVKKNDVVVTCKSSKVKIVVVDIDPKEKILVTGGMIIVRPNTTKLNPTYLKLYLDSENGQLAMKSIQKGSYIVSMNSKDIANLLIPIINIEKQNIAAEKYNEKLSTLIAYKKEIEKIENNLRNFYNAEFEED